MVECGLCMKEHGENRPAFPGNTNKCISPSNCEGEEGWKIKIQKGIWENRGEKAESLQMDKM